MRQMVSNGEGRVFCGCGEEIKAKVYKALLGERMNNLLCVVASQKKSYTETEKGLSISVQYRNVTALQ